MAKLLMVEDDEMIRRMLALRLSLQGHEVDQAVNGQEGKDKALAGDYALVLMDMHMPVMDGHEAVKSLRESGYRGTIVAVTASAMSEESQRAIDSGCDHFIAKPIGNDFEDQISAILEVSTDG